MTQLFISFVAVLVAIAVAFPWVLAGLVRYLEWVYKKCGVKL